MRKCWKYRVLDQLAILRNTSIQIFESRLAILIQLIILFNLEIWDIKNKLFYTLKKFKEIYFKEIREYNEFTVFISYFYILAST